MRLTRPNFLLSLIILTAACQLPIAAPAAAQMLQSDKFKFNIENIQLHYSDQPADAPQPPPDFRRRGYIAGQLPPDKTVSHPFVLAPAAYLLRAKPGAKFSLPLTVYNFKDPAVLQIETKQLSLRWFSLSATNFFLEAGQQKQIKLAVKLPANAAEGDYYFNLRASDFKKPYLYTSTTIYLTVTKTGIIQQNISVSGFDFAGGGIPALRFIPWRLIDSTKQHTLSIKITNGSPYFANIPLKLHIRSPFGLELTKDLPPLILLANQSANVTTNIADIPFGAAKIEISSANAPALFIFALPFPQYLLPAGGIVLLLFAALSVGKRTKQHPA